MQMVTHGVTTGALFLLVGALHERTRSRDMRDYGGLAAKVPRFAALLSLALLASMGLPGLAGFVSELHALAGGFERWSFPVVIASVGVLISAAYSIRAISRLFLGPPDARWVSLADLRPRELLAVAPLGVLMIGLGVAPGALLRLIEVAASAMASAF
jgi:NADH-quinone oxidoreductase subunit M